MSIQNLTIENVLEGWSTTDYFSSKGQYNSSLGVDPDFPIGSATKTSGVLVPIRYEKFSGTELTGNPNWIITNNKTSDSYVYTTTGKVHSFDSSIAMRATDAATSPASFPLTLTGGAGNGGAYYNNYVYFAEATDISEYGPLINAGGTQTSVLETENVWTGAKFTLTALSNVTYPSLQGVTIPNHPMHVHTDTSMYIGDTLAGQGIIHRLNTKTSGGIEGSVKGTTVVSAYNVLDLPFGYYPTDIESYGTDLVISAIQTTNSTINQGKAALFFWDPTNTDSFYRQIALPDPLCTALLNVNGVLHIWSGNASNGVRISRYIGGETVSEIAYSEEGTPPFAGAVDALGSRLVWGISTTYPETSASVMAFGSKIEALPHGIHNIARSTASGTTPTVTSLKYVQQANNIQPRVIMGHGTTTAWGLDKLSSSATFNSVWRSKIFNINKRFVVKKLEIPLAGSVDANTTITVKIRLDDLSSSITLPVINNTNYPSKRKVMFKAADLLTATGENNFMIEIAWTGTTSMPVLVPINLKVDISDDEE